jgi:hypothetical protein
MIRTVRGLRVTGVECTLLALAASLDDEALEIACEDARRRRLTSVPAIRAYLARFGVKGRPGVQALRRLVDELDPVHAARSTLEVRTRRLLVAHGIADFEPVRFRARSVTGRCDGGRGRFAGCEQLHPQSETRLEEQARRRRELQGLGLIKGAVRKRCGPVTNTDQPEGDTP